MGSAPRSLSGIQAKKSLFMILTQALQVPSQQSLAVFSSSEPASFTGVVAGTEGCLTRRWNCGGGRVAQLGDFLDYPVGKASSEDEDGRFTGENVLGKEVSECSLGLALDDASAGGDFGGASESDRLHVMSEAWPRRFPRGAFAGTGKSREFDVGGWCRGD